MAKHLNFHRERPLISATQGIVFQWIKRLPLFWITVLSCMTSVLIIVAVLQYRWTKQLTVTSEARLTIHLQPLMIGWHLDFYGELSAICVALQVGPDSGARDNWNDCLRRYVDWSHAPMNHDLAENVHANPDLIKNIFIWETSDRATPRLLRLNADTGKIEISSVPEDLQPLLARLKAKSSSLSVGLRAWEFPDSHQPKNAREATTGSRLQLPS